MTSAELKSARRRLGLTQTQLGLLLSPDAKPASAKTMVSHKECGVRPVTERDVLALEALAARASAVTLCATWCCGRLEKRLDNRS